MSDRPLMKCGCVAQGHFSRLKGEVFDPPIPGCLAHDCIEVMSEKPDLTGRMARCAYSAKNPHGDRPSDYNLPFFEYRGPGSPDAKNLCKHCKYHRIAHEGKRALNTCTHFEPHGPFEFDRYYCGCFGWD